MVDEILAHVGTMTWEAGCWSDDNLSSKKLYPNYQFSAKSKKWVARIKTSKDSMALCVKRTQTIHESQPIYMRKKPDTSMIEALSERAAAVHSIGNEVLMSVPIKPEIMQKEWFNAWSSGSDHIDVEVQVALMDKSDSFQPSQHIPTLKKIIDTHMFSSPVVQTTSKLEALEVDEFNLLMKKIKYDVTVYENWQLKCSSALAAREHAMQEFKAKRRGSAEEIATNFLAKVAKVVVFDGNQKEDLIAEVMNFKRDHIAAKLGIKAADIPMVPVLNWAAPSLISKETQDTQIALLTWALHENMQSAALVLHPVFTYNKGKLYLEETRAITELSKGNHNLDWQFNVLFREKVDHRDLRPMIYPGRFIFPSPIGDPKHNMWFNCELRESGRTTEVKQLAPKNMKEVEDMSMDALPMSTDLRDGHIHGASKYVQIGVPAAEALLTGLFTGADLQSCPAVLVLDLYPRVGDLFIAFCQQRRMQNATPLFYFAIADDQTEATWMEKHLVHLLGDKVEDGSFGVETLDKEIKEDLLEPIPRLPDMNILVAPGSKKELGIPAALVKKWRDHPSFGKEFQAWLDAFAEKYSVIDPDAAEGEPDNQGQEASGKKRGAEEGGSSAGSPAKKAKAVEGAIVEFASIKEALLSEVKMSGKGAPQLQLRAPHCIYIVNTGQQEWSSNMGQITGFGKGSFKLLKGDSNEDPNKYIEFKLESDADLVVLSGAVVPLGKVMADQREKKPDSQACYHSLVIDQQDPKKFTVTQTHRVAFFPKEDGEDNALNFGRKEPATAWSSHALAVHWAVRWAAKGLMPVKPIVHLKGSIALPPGRAILCSNR